LQPIEPLLEAAKIDTIVFVPNGKLRLVPIGALHDRQQSIIKKYAVAYDDLLTMKQFQGLLQTKNLHDQPIDLLTLSACKRATGDDRAPLGFAGVAIKAKARSAMGTLWSVDDEATSWLMPRFYEILQDSSESKIKALRKAQLLLMDEAKLTHPYYWAPFILVGDWQ